MRLTPLVAGPLLLLTAVACASETTIASPGVGAETAFDLLSCDVRPSCDEVCSHIGWGDCSGGDFAELRACVDETLLGRGVIVNLERPGGSTWIGERITVAPGDGTVVRQLRARGCQDPTCNLALQPWVVEAQERCTVYDDGTECEPQDGPSGNVCTPVVVEDCEPIPTEDELTCADLR